MKPTKGRNGRPRLARQMRETLNCPRHRILTLSVWLLLACWTLPSSHLQALSHKGGTPIGEDENVLKARFLAKVCSFVDWPRESNMEDTSQPFVIGILPGPNINPEGEHRWDDLFVRSMRSEFKKTTVKNKRVILKNLNSLDDIKACQAIYVMSKKGLLGVLNVTKPLHTLVFGQTEGFAELGVHLNFMVVNARLRFEINESSFHESALKIDSMILRSAIVVKRREGKP